MPYDRGMREIYATDIAVLLALEVVAVLFCPVFGQQLLETAHRKMRGAELVEYVAKVCPEVDTDQLATQDQGKSGRASAAS